MVFQDVRIETLTLTVVYHRSTVCTIYMEQCSLTVTDGGRTDAILLFDTGITSPSFSAAARAPEARVFIFSLITGDEVNIPNSVATHS